MTQLLDLPPELFKQIFDEFADRAALPELFRARAVCRTFVVFLGQRIGTMTRLEASEAFHSSLTPPSTQGAPSMGIYLEERVPDLLFYHAKDFTASTNRNVAACLNRIANYLLHFTSATSVTEALRNRYLKDLCHAFGAMYVTFKPTSIEVPALRASYWLRESILEPDYPSTTNALGAAAAVGSVEAVRHYLAEGGKVFAVSPGLHNPILCAASTGKDEVLKILLGALDQEITTFGPVRGDDGKILGKNADGFRVIKDAIRLSIRFGHISCALMLIPFVQVRFPEHFANAGDAFLLQATQSGRVDMVRAVIGLKALRITSRPLELALHEALQVACFEGPIELVRYLFEEFSFTLASTTWVKPPLDVHTYEEDNFIRRSDALEEWIQCDTDRHGPGSMQSRDLIMLAAQNGHRAMVDLLVSYGGTLNSIHIVGALYRSDVAHQLLSVFHMVQQLLRAGAIVDKSVLMACERRTGLVQRAFYDREKIHCRTSDAAMTAIIIAHRAMGGQCSEDLRNCGSIELFMRLIVNGKIKVPTEPLPFLEMAREVLQWTRNSVA